MPERLLHKEKETLLRVMAGDEKAFAALFAHYYEHIYGFAFSVTKSASLTEEIVQDVFVRVWNNRAQLGEIQKFDAWLFIIARNQAYKVIRQKVNDPRFVQELDEYFHLYPEAADDRLLFKESSELIGKAASTLPRQQQLVFTLSRVDGYSLDEIAGQLQLSKNTVKAHLSKALQGIRMYLQLHAYEFLFTGFLFRCLFLS